MIFKKLIVNVYQIKDMHPLYLIMMLSIWRFRHTSPLYSTTNNPKPQMIPDRSDPNCRVQMIPWKVEEWNRF